MTSILRSLDIGGRALLAHQQVLNTVGHNLANAATAGYTRQRAALTPLHPQRGVEVAEIIRVRDVFLDAALLDETGRAGLAETRHGLTQRLEAVFGDGGPAVDGALASLFQMFQDLSIHPADPALRLVTVQAADQLAATFRQTASRLDRTAADLADDAGARVDVVNRLLGQIAELNTRIVALRGQPVPNDLLDQRDARVSELAGQLGVAVSARDDGSIGITALGSGILLVEGPRAATLSSSVDPITGRLVFQAGGTVLTPATGALAAIAEVRDSPAGALRQAITDLDTLARAVVEEINRVHASGTGLLEPSTVTAGNAVTSPAAALTAAGLDFPPGTGTARLVVHDAAGAVLSDVTVTVTGGVTTLEDVRAALDADPNLAASISGGRLTVTAATGATLAFGADSAGLFAGIGINRLFTGTDARSIAVDPDVAASPGRLATARLDADGLVHAGDGASALALAGLRTAPVMSAGTESFSGFYAGLVARLGTAGRQAGQASEQAATALAQTQSFHAQVSGVSTDEELIALTQAQHAYAAAARFVTTIDEAIQTLLAMAT